MHQLQLHLSVEHVITSYSIHYTKLYDTSTRRANAIAFDVREKGRPMREGNTITGKPIKDDKGNPVMIPGTLKATKAIGWFIDEYGIAQVSMNITNIGVTPLHIAFDEICKKAQERGIRVSGTEIVGLVPNRITSYNVCYTKLLRSCDFAGRSSTVIFYSGCKWLPCIKS